MDLDLLKLDLSAAQWATFSTLMLINVILFLSAGAIAKKTMRDENKSDRVKLTRAISFFTGVMLIISILLTGSQYNGFGITNNIANSLFTILCSLFVFQFSAYYSRKRFGIKKEVDKETVYVETYSCRLVNIILSILIGMIVLYTLIKIWGADSLLETTGIFGLIFAFLAFTSAQWAPDLISGLVILNAQSLEDGDVVCIDGYDDEYIISKVSFIYSILFDIRDNNRTIIRNSRILQGKVENLSRIASTEGIRRSLSYKIGYPTIIGKNSSERTKVLDEFNKTIEDMFDTAYKTIKENEDVKINRNKHFEWALTQAGDDALEYTLWYYLERTPSTKVTATIRKHLIGTGFKINEAIYRAAVGNCIDLSTPSLSAVTIKPNSPFSPSRPPAS